MFVHLIFTIFYPTYSRANIDALVSLIQQCFAGNQAKNGNDIELLHTKLVAHYTAFISEIRFNLLNINAFSPKLQVEEVFAGLNRFASSMIRNSYVIDNLFAAKGWEPIGIKYCNPVYSEERYAEAEADDVSGRSLRAVQTGLDSGQSVESLFAALTPIELRVIQQGLASAFVKKAWEELNGLYSLHGGIAREVPREAYRMLVTGTPVRQDLQRYRLGIGELPISEFPTEAHALEEWARHLNHLRWWNHPFSRTWPAPIEYEQAFHEASDRDVFLSTRLRLLDTVEPILLVADEDNLLFREDNQILSESDREEMRRSGLRRARIVAGRMRKWLQLRKRPASDQFIEALERILLVPDWDEQWKPTGKLTVAYHHTEHDAELQFNFLLTRLREQVLPDSTALDAFRRRLEQFIANSMTKLDGGGFGEISGIYGFRGLYKALIDQFPQLTLIDGVADITYGRAEQLADDFWARFTTTLIWRKPWAERALDFVETTAGKAAKNLDKSKLSLRQIALLYIYNDDIIDRGEGAKQIAAQHGYISGERLTKNYNYYMKN